jgi:hypothetical protein
MNDSDQKINTMKQFFIDNIKYLFELNRLKNNQKKSNFINETAIKRTAINGWMHGKIPIDSNINTIVHYFNKWLNLNISKADLLDADLKNIINEYQVKDKNIKSKLI